MIELAERLCGDGTPVWVTARGPRQREHPPVGILAQAAPHEGAFRDQQLPLAPSHSSRSSFSRSLAKSRGRCSR